MKTLDLPAMASGVLVLVAVGASALLAQAPLQPPPPPPPKESPNSWARAEAAIAEHLKGIDPSMQSAEVKSARLEKFLPDLRVFVRIDRHMGGETRIFLINRAAEITQLPEEDWRGDNEAQCFRVRSIASFLQGRKIKIGNADEALEAAKLFEEIQGAQNYVAFLKINTKDFTAFDKRFMEQFYGADRNWKFTASARQGGWTVKKEYVGPPGMIPQPPTYELDVNAQLEFQDLRRYPYPKER